MTKLLVSVKNQSEAVLAARAGAEVIDLKDPQAGPLGMVSPEILLEIPDLVEEFPQQPELSCALGELSDWPSERRLSIDLSRYDYVKVGPGEFSETEIWLETLKKFWRRLPGRNAARIAVVYADLPLGKKLLQNTPANARLLAQLSQAGCDGLLVDTCRKAGPGLCDLISPEQLQAWCHVCRQEQLLCSLAGKLTEEEICRLIGDAQVMPDLYAVRSAACENADRSGTLSARRIASLRQKMLFAARNSTPVDPS